MTRRQWLLALNVVPLAFSLFLVHRFYLAQPGLNVFAWRNAGVFVALVVMCVAGYCNSIWRYIMALKHEGATVDETSISERLMYVNLISFFFPFGVLNYAAQLAFVYKHNAVRVVGRAFLHDKLVFLTAIAACALLSLADVGPRFAAALGFSPALITLGSAIGVAGVIGLAGYLAWRGYTFFLFVQLAVFAGLNALNAVLLEHYIHTPGGLFAVLQKIFAYSLAVVLPISLGGVGPREAILLFDVADPALRAAVLNFCAVWFLALVTAAVLLFVAKRPATALAVRCYQRWRGRR